MTDPQVKRLLQTPLLLAHLDARSRRPAPDQVTTRAEVLERVLSTIVERSGLPQLTRFGPDAAEPSHWVHALMFVAWRMFARLRGDVAVPKLREEAQEMMRAWQRHLALRGSLQQAGDLLSGFALLCEPQACDALLSRSVLHPSGPDEVRFLHREWQDYLTARYLAESIRWKYVDELGHFAFTLPMFLGAGEILGNLRIEADLIREIEERTVARNEPLIHANFCAVLGNSRTPMSPEALAMLLGDLRKMSLLSRLVTLASFGARAMKNASNDPSVGDIRAQLVKSFRALVEDESVDRLSRSLAWCNIKAFHHTFGTEAPPGAWPGLGDPEADEDAAPRAALRPRVQAVPGHPAAPLAAARVGADPGDDPRGPAPSHLRRALPLHARRREEAACTSPRSIRSCPGSSPRAPRSGAATITTRSSRSSGRSSHAAAISSLDPEVGPASAGGVAWPSGGGAGARGVAVGLPA